MADQSLSPQHPGPTLLCAGTDPAAAARLAEVAVSLLGDRPAIVLATWEPPALGLFESTIDALYDARVDLRDAARQAAMRTAQAAADVLDAHGVHVTRQVCPEDQFAWQEIISAADEFDVGIIVAGTTEDAHARVGTLGRQARALAHRAHRPLLLVPADAMPAGDSEPAIFASDGSPTATRAVTAASALLLPRPAVVVSVWETATCVVGVAMLAVPDDVVRKGAEGLDEAARLRAAGQASEDGAILTSAGWSSCVTEAVKTSRNVPTAIVETADERDAAIIVAGTRGRSRIAAALLGSNAEAIARGAGRPVLLVPPVAQ